MKILLDNRTELSNEDIGIIIDDLQEREKGTTQYYGKWKGYELELRNGKIIKIEDMKTIYAICETIQNLIQRNKDLEQIEKEHKEENGRLREKNINLKEKIIRQQEQLNIANKKILAQRGQLKVVNNSYIPISKLKEKMELLREDIQYSANPLSIDNSKYAIEVLEELLEESEK